MPKDKKLRVEIIQLYHDVLVAGYERRQKMIKLVTRNYWWLEVTKDMGKYIDSCNMYQRIKNRIQVPVEKLKLSKVLKKLQIHLIVDFITKLPLVAGKDIILVVCNRLSKMIYFVTITEKTTVEGLA